MIAALSGPAELKQFDRYALFKKNGHPWINSFKHTLQAYTQILQKNLKIHKKVKTFKTLKKPTKSYDELTMNLPWT